MTPGSVDPDLSPPDPFLVKVRNSSLIRQTALQIGGRGSAAVLSAAWLAVAAHELPLADFGHLALLLALHQVFFFIADPGVSVLVADDVAQRNKISRSLLTQAVNRRLVGVAVAEVVILVAYVATAGSATWEIPLLFFGSVVGNALHTTFTAALRASGRVVADAVNELVSRLGLLLVGTIWLVNGGGLAAAAICYSLADLASSLVLGPHVWRLAEVDDENRRGVFALRRALPIAAGASTSSVYQQVDTWLLNILRTASQAGLYAACYRLLAGVTLPASALSSLIITYAVPAQAAARRTVVARFMGMAIALSLLLALPLFVFAEPILGFVFGDPFRSQDTTLRLLLVAAIPGAIVATLAPLVAVTDGRSFFRSFLLGSVLNIALNIALVPTHDTRGAAVALLVSHLTLGVALTLATARWARQPAGFSNT